MKNKKNIWVKWSYLWVKRNWYAFLIATIAWAKVDQKLTTIREQKTYLKGRQISGQFVPMQIFFIISQIQCPFPDRNDNIKYFNKTVDFIGETFSFIVS